MIDYSMRMDPRISGGRYVPRFFCVDCFLTYFPVILQEEIHGQGAEGLIVMYLVH